MSVRKVVPPSNAAVLDMVTVMNKGAYNVFHDCKAQGQGAKVLIDAELSVIRLR